MPGTLVTSLALHSIYTLLVTKTEAVEERQIKHYRHLSSLFRSFCSLHHDRGPAEKSVQRLSKGQHRVGQFRCCAATSRP